MSKKISIGIPYTKVGDLDATIHRCLQWGYPQIILPGQKANVDVVVIPDGVGAYPGMLCFAGEPSSAAFRCIQHPMCPLTEAFRITFRGFTYYREIRGVPIIGIGEGSIMIWDHLGGKVGVSPENYWLLKTDHLTVNQIFQNKLGGPESFSHDGLHGVDKLESTIFSSIMQAIVKDVFNTTVLTQDKNWANPQEEDNSDFE
jgi:hypothetical protein